jgi:hypothetical protein
VVHVGFRSELVDCRMKPGPLFHEIVKLVLVWDVTLTTGAVVPGGDSGFVKSTQAKLKSASL